MLDREVIATLPQISPPVLTAYLDTNPSNPRNQGRPSGARIWLKSRAKEIAGDLPLRERKLFRKQVVRVDRFLSTGTAATDLMKFKDWRHGSVSGCASGEILVRRSEPI